MTKVTPFQLLACPLDAEPLTRDGPSWRCPAGHSFDVARQGYVHLLPVQNKRSLDPGDSKAMVAARQRFLNAGHYRPVAHAVAQQVLTGTAEAESLSCLDAGCGEGYYLRELAASSSPAGCTMLGVDISKWAVLAAARQSGPEREQRPAWVVASNANLPVQSATVDSVLCIFGFPVYGEFARVLRPGGQLVQVDAGPDHLLELREIIYPQLKGERASTGSPQKGFTAGPIKNIRFELALAGAGQIADLLAMTPHLYRASAEGREKAAALQKLTVTVDVRLRTFLRDQT
ncbi:putative RNA methyltransferase [Marinobacter salicampi]|uniref:putative RNA methyltransferase n=1 Tax=Marinobacter salicampi TaxID=435907 RepID=UPI0014091A46|nr:methyltransferase domain-containing protein [Marinobacter salicampi]